MLKREWGVESNGKLPHLFIPTKTATQVSELETEDLPLGRISALVPEFAVKELPLGRTLMMMMIWYIRSELRNLDLHFHSLLPCRNLNRFSLKLFNTNVKSVFYGCKTWNVTTEIYSKLQVYTNTRFEIHYRNKMAEAHKKMKIFRRRYHRMRLQKLNVAQGN